MQKTRFSFGRYFMSRTRDSELNPFQADRRADPAGDGWSSAASGATGQIRPRVRAQVPYTAPVVGTEQRQYMDRQLIPDEVMGVGEPTQSL